MLSKSHSEVSSGLRVRSRRPQRQRARRRKILWCVLSAVLLISGGLLVRTRAISQEARRAASVQFVALPFAAGTSWNARPLNTIARCDVIVVGATPAGVAAALAASRRGARVVVVESREHAGGDIVYAMLNMFDVVARPGEASPTHGIFSEFFEQLGFACDIDKARKLFESALREQPNIRFFTRAQVTQIYQTQKRVIGLQISQRPKKDAPPQWQNIECASVIDATNDADIAARAGAGFYLGREDINRDRAMQSAGLLFSVKNVSWNRVRNYVSGRRLADAANFNLSDTDLAPGENQTSFQSHRRRARIQSCQQSHAQAGNPDGIGRAALAPFGSCANQSGAKSVGASGRRDGRLCVGARRYYQNLSSARARYFGVVD